MTPEDRTKRINELQAGAQKAFDLVVEGKLDAEQARAAADDMLMILADLIDMSDSLAAGRRHTRGRDECTTRGH
jgi:hypothetical protein